MRRALILLLPLLLLSLATPALGRGLYVGHGLRSVDHAWTARLNLGGGIHGAEDALVDRWDESWGWNELGGFGQAGLELRLAREIGLELHAGWRELEDSEHFLLYPSFQNVYARYDLEAAFGGITLRQYQLVRGAAVYWGAGVGLARAESSYQEVIDGHVLAPVKVEDTAGEAHLLVGWESYVGDTLGLGLEVGYRFSGLDEGVEYSGVFLGLRLGVLLGR